MYLTVTVHMTQILFQVAITARLWVHINAMSVYDAESMPWSNEESAVRNAVSGENGAMKSNAKTPFEFE